MDTGSPTLIGRSITQPTMEKIYNSITGKFQQTNWTYINCDGSTSTAGSFYEFEFVGKEDCEECP